MKISKYGFLFFILPFISSCSDDVIVAPVPEGKFVVEYVDYRTGEGISPRGYIASYIEYKIQYHFEGLPGTADALGFQTDADSIAIGMYLDYAAPVIINKTKSFNETLWLTKKLTPGGSIKVSVSIHGHFWDYKNGSYINYNGFKWKDEKSITY